MNNDITKLLMRIKLGQATATEELFILVYDEMRRLARWKLNDEKQGHTLQPTALVNEAYLRLVGNNSKLSFESRKEFFVAAAEAMRHILIDAARRKLARKRGGGAHRESLDIDRILVRQPEELIDVHEALDALAQHDRECSELVKLHYFGGYSLSEVAELLNISRSTANRWWIYAKAWLKDRIEQ